MKALRDDYCVDSCAFASMQHDLDKMECTTCTGLQTVVNRNGVEICSSARNTLIIIGAVSGAILLALLIFGAVVYINKRKQTGQDDKEGLTEKLLPETENE